MDPEEEKLKTWQVSGNPQEEAVLNFTTNLLAERGMCVFNLLNVYRETQNNN